MKFTCLQENLNKGLNIIYRAIPTKSALPILSHVLISAENGRVKLSATNLETAISTYIGASVEEEGSITIPAKLIKEFVSNLSPNTLEVVSKEEILHIKSEKTKSKFNGAGPQDYPALPTFSKEIPHIELDPASFAQAVSMVTFAASTDESRPVLTGTLFKWDGGNDGGGKGVLTIASSDGFRLSEVTIDTTTSTGTGNKKSNVGAEDFSVIIPAKTVAEVARIFAGATEPIKFGLNKDESLALFESGDTLVATRLVEGDYIDYSRIIPTSQTLTAQFSAEELLEAVKLSSVFSYDKATSNVVGMKFDPKGFISVSTADTSDMQSGNHESKIQAEIEGDPIDITFNARFLLDLLNNAKTEKMDMVINTTTAPCLFKMLDHTNFLHIVAPIQIQS